MAYEGTAYAGWQFQPNVPTIQRVLETTFSRITGYKVRAVAASRTDAGVHAMSQVVVVPNPSSHSPEKLCNAFNALLPDDIVILDADWAQQDFNVRRDVVGKHYCYTIHFCPTPPLFTRNLCWHIKYALNIGAMNRATRVLKGTHDFSSFRASQCNAKSPIRTIDKIGWRVSKNKLVLDVFGRAFLKQMIRNIVGTLVEVGRGRFSADYVRVILQALDRTRAGPTAPAKGLCLQKVFYDKDEYKRILLKNTKAISLV
jgi:tRNA pseudouridine38-40 synthase